jgi:hypothetical protein
MTNDLDKTNDEDAEPMPWDLYVFEAQKLGLEFSDARDLVIEKWLTEAGDPRPFIDWVLHHKHQPSPEIVKIIAMMMSKEKTPGLFLKGDAALQFKLIVKGDRAGRRRDFVAVIRDDYAGREISKLMDSGLKHSAAEDIVREWLASEGYSASGWVIEKARMKARRGRGKNRGN